MHIQWNILYAYSMEYTYAYSIKYNILYAYSMEYTLSIFYGIYTVSPGLTNAYEFAT